MLQQDYLMRMLIQFFQAVTRAMEEGNKRRPDEAAEALENAMSEAIDMDANVMLGLEQSDALADAFDIDRIDHEALPVEDLESQMRDMLRADGIEEADLER